MSCPPNLQASILDAWKTNHHVTIFLVEHLPPELWQSKLPGETRRSIRTLSVHLHNVRCRWIKTLGSEHGIHVPAQLDRSKTEHQDLVSALHQSSKGIRGLLKLGCDQGGSIPDPPSYVWRNLPLDVGHVLGYFIAHEAHHRGQIVLLARQLGHRLPSGVTDGLWQWSKLARDA